MSDGARPHERQSPHERHRSRHPGRRRPGRLGRYPLVPGGDVLPRLRSVRSTRQRDLLALRFVEIEAELTAIAERRVVDGDPAEVEAKLLYEQDEIEFTLGIDYCRPRDAW
jgi:hypothetical protein